MDLVHRLQGPLIVTGSAGFVGARLFTSLLAQRDDVYAIVRDEPGWRLDQIDTDRIVRCDLNDFDATGRMVEDLAPRTVFHCASYGAYPFEDDATRIYETNVAALVNLVKRLSGRSVAAFVHSGSSSEYGTNCAGPTEDAPCYPNSTYAASKVSAADYLRVVGESWGFPCVNLRLYSVYGPLEDTSRLVPSLVYEALQGRLPPFVEGDITRDFVHVDDVCEAFVKSAAHMSSSFYGASFNIGTGRCTSIAEAAETARRIFGVDEQPRFGAMENRAWDLTDWFADPARAREAFAWEAKVSFEEGLRSVGEWLSEMTEDEFLACSKRTGSASGGDIAGPVGGSISAVIACYRDAEAIPEMHRRLTSVLDGLGIDYEIIFVDDGSPDDCAGMIRAISETDSRVLGIVHSRNFGSQMAFRSGMELASKDSVVLLDGDLQDPPEIISQFYPLWQSGHDVVYGIRSKREMSALRSLGHKAFYRLFRRFSYVDVPVDAGDFALMNRRVVDWILDSPERDLFIRGLRAYVGFRQTGVEYLRPERKFGRSTNDFGRYIGWAKRGILSFSDAPLAMLTAIGAVAFLLSAAASAVVVTLRLFVPDVAPRGATTLLVVILLLGSLNLFAVGIVGEYIAKIMTEVKRRPRMIRAALIRAGEVEHLGWSDQRG